MGTIGGSVANNDPAACYPSAVLALGRDRRHLEARDRRRRLLPGPVHHRAGRRRADHRHPLPGAQARGLRSSCARRPRTFRWSACSWRSTTAACAWPSPARGNGVFRHKGLEDALNQSFTPRGGRGVKIDASDLNSDLHASAAYRANLISVLTQRAVTKALG
jgi:carbon-monoxide dehydrogenase medium subunit